MMFERLGHLLVRFRTWILALLVLLTAGAAALLPGLGFDFGAEALLEFSDDEARFAKQVQDRFGSHDHLMLVVLDTDEATDGVLGPDGLTVLHQLTHDLEAIDGVDGAFSITRVPSREIALGSLLGGGGPRPLIDELPVEADDAARVVATVTGSRVIENQLVSADHETASVVLSIDEALADPADFAPVLDQIEATTAAIVDGRNAEAGADLFEVHYGGLPYLRAATVRTMQAEQMILWPAVAGAYLVLLLLLFRTRLRTAALPLLAVGVATLWTMGLMVLCGLRMNMLNNAVPILILVIGVTNSVHVMMCIDEELERIGPGGELGPAIARGVGRVGKASLLTTLTAAVGFAALVVARSTLVGEFGLLMAGGIMLAYASIIVMLPVLLALVLPRRRAPDADAATGLDERPRAHESLLGRTLARAVRPVAGHARAVLVGAVVLLGATAWIGLQSPIDANFLETLEPDHPISKSNELIEHQLGGILPLDVDLRAEPGTFGRADALQRVAAFQEDVAEVDGVLSAMSVVDVIGATGVGGGYEGVMRSDAAVSTALSLVRSTQPQALDAMATEALDEIRVMVRLEAAGVAANLESIETIRALADDHFAHPVHPAAGPAMTAALGGANPAADAEAVPHIEARLTGLGYLASVGLGAFVQDLFTSLLTATVFILLVLIVAFRSVRIGLMGLLPSLLPMGLTLAVMPLYGYALNATTVIVLTITIGLAVDNTIHLMVRFGHERRRRAADDVAGAIEATVRGSGRAVVLSNLLLIGGFSVLAMSGFMPIRTVAVLSITTIVAAMLCALVLVPAQLALFGASAFPATVRAPLRVRRERRLRAGAMATRAVATTSITTTPIASGRTGS